MFAASFQPLDVPGLAHTSSVLPTPPYQGQFSLFQGIIWPQVLSGALGNCVNALANYILVFVLSLGIR